jgi:N utilization substance protein B
MPDEPDEKPARKSQRRDNRVAAMQFLYMWDLNPPNELAEQIMTFFTHQEQPRAYYQFAEELIQGAISEIESLDAVIRERAKNWEFKRIAKVDLAILRLAIYEMLYRNDIPPIVSINEAIDLSKNYSGADSRRFVNGILDQLKLTLNRPLREAME